MATTPTYAWPYPDLGALPDGPDTFENLAQAMETTLGGDNTLSFTPTLVTTGAAFTNSNGTAIGRYRVWKGWCQMQALITFGSAVVGGTGSIRMNLPVMNAPSNIPAETYIIADLSVPGWGHVPGAMLLLPDATSSYLYFNLSQTDARVGAFSNANAANTVGTGVPLRSGQYTIQSGGYLVVAGRYRTV